MEAYISDKIIPEQQIWTLLEDVMDPEIRALSVVDLGIIPQIDLRENTFLTVFLTPTFSGCPAIHIMQQMIKDRILETFPNLVIEVKVDYTRTWNSNLITDKGREALKNFELAPPKKYTGELDMDTISDAACPMCGSKNTTMQSPFGPTLCRAIHYCYDCKQSFQQFKPV